MQFFTVFVFRIEAKLQIAVDAFSVVLEELVQKILVTFAHMAGNIVRIHVLAAFFVLRMESIKVVA